MMSSINELRLQGIQQQELVRAKLASQTSKVKVEGAKETKFANALQDALAKKNELQLSKHAQLRMEQRGILYTPKLQLSLQQAVEQARLKGVKSLAVIGDQAAFIVSVPAKTVITAMAGEELKEQIFTNIDGAVHI